MITATNISKAIQGKRILSNVDLSVKESSVTAIIGPSGGGKSTLLRILSMVETADIGTINVDHKQIKFPFAVYPIRNMHPMVTIVFQQFHLWPHLSIEKNIFMPVSALGRTIDREKYENLIDVFEIRDLIFKFPYEISVGQKQRVALTRAIMLNPRYLFLDEITSALDIKHVDKVLRYLNFLKKDGVGIVIATHLIGFASKVADHIVFLDNGKIAEQGDRSILSNPKTELLFKFLSYLDYAG